MPCYEVNTMSVEFKAKYKSILVQTLTSLGFKLSVNNNKIYTSNFTFDLDKQKVKFPSGYQNQINGIKQKYSQIVLEQVAKKRRWILKNKGVAGEFQLIKY